MRKTAHVSGLEFEVSRKGATHEQRQNQQYEFIGWDGEEVKDGGYCLFGNSVGGTLCDPVLDTADILRLIIDTGVEHPKAFHVIYSGYYDVNWWLKDIGKLRLAVLHKTGKVMWEGYKIEYIPHKIFTLSKEIGGKTVRVRIDDCFTFFRCRFDKALEKFGIGTKSERADITRGKDHRQSFYWYEIGDIRKYWKTELRLLVDLMNRLRKDVNSAGIFIGQWHGPGALASHALKQHKMKQFMRETPDEIMEAVMSAYSAGWFERFMAGYYDGKVYTADINSAYVHAISQLPNLANGVWKHVEKPDPDSVHRVRFAVYHIRMRGNFSRYLASCHGIPMPLPFRDRTGTISHPVSCEGWYWAPEAAIVARDAKSEILEAWIFEDDGTYPFAWVQSDYRQRLVFQKLDNPCERIIKWMLASIYGRLAQRVGWDEVNKKPPAWHQLEWAGFITSFCRAMIFRAAMDVGKRNGLVSIDTDGIISTVPFDEKYLENGIGEELGQWKVEEFDGIVYIQNGIYWLKDNASESGWKEPKLRGIPKEQVKSEEDAFIALSTGGKIHLVKQSFIGYGQALATDWNRWRTWETRPHEIDVHNSGKRQHVAKLCRACHGGFNMLEKLHDLAPVFSEDFVSKPHTLPWKNPKKVRTWEILRHMDVLENA